MNIEIIYSAEARVAYGEQGLMPATLGSAACDLKTLEHNSIFAGACLPIKTGLKINILEPGFCAMVLPRSGLGAKKGLILGNTVGLIDNDYQGDITCYMWNRSSETIHLPPYERFAQIIFLPFIRPYFIPVEKFRLATQRGEGGFGSTGRTEIELNDLCAAIDAQAGRKERALGEP